jgi:CheY-like chemotaxis protein
MGAVRVAGEAVALLRDQGRDVIALLDLLLAEVDDLDGLAGELLGDRRDRPAEAAADVAEAARAAAQAPGGHGIGLFVSAGSSTRPGDGPASPRARAAGRWWAAPAAAASRRTGSSGHRRQRLIGVSRGERQCGNRSGSSWPTTTTRSSRAWGMVLSAEDDPEVVVALAGDGASALQAVLTHRSDVLVVDTHMSSGPAVTELVRLVGQARPRPGCCCWPRTPGSPPPANPTRVAPRHDPGRGRRPPGRRG